MTYKAFCSNISRPLIQEDFRRYWPISIIGFLIYFFSGVFPILLGYQDLTSISYYIVNILHNINPLFLLTHLTLPVTTAVVLFRYLQNVSSVAVIHAMPFQRITLYISHFLSGIVLIASPIIANGLILLAISKPVMQEDTLTAAENIFSRTIILAWILQSLLIVIFLYTISVFSGIITGNTLMHFCSAIAFNFLLPVLYSILIVYFEKYLFGFYTKSGEAFAYNLSPLLAAMYSTENFTPLQYGFYIAAILIFFVLSAFLYEKRNLEKVSDMLVYPFCEPIICYLITFLSMSIMGTYFNSLGSYDTYVGYFCGALIGFLIGRIIVKKNVRIFNFTSLKSFSIYLVIAAIFFISLEFDVISYEKRLPAENNMQTVSMDYALSGFSYNYNDYRGYDELITKYSNPENIQSILRFHRQIIDNKDKILEGKTDSVNLFSPILLTYKTKSGRVLNRYYEVPQWLIEKNENLKALYESSEFRSDLPLMKIPKEDLQQATLTSSITSAIDPSITNTDLKGLVSAINKDIKNLTYEQLQTFNLPLCRIELKYTDRNLKLNGPAPNTTDATRLMEYAIRPNYSNTIAWLNENNYTVYTDYMRKAPLYAIGIYLNDEEYKKTYKITKYDPYLDAYYTPKLEVPQQQENLIVIEDLNKIRELYELSSNMQITGKQYYSFQIVYEAKNGGAVSTECYLDTTIAPDYISDYFH
ncbi:hypothetical protein [Sinanaerobacter sp. ZZT-01]|uniref:hypothetical protein n=1 Tax=Sinanaerobacter sp. ZZT-01 TaxID=3111540 RepID=UPI002D767A6E|nr:hypothetical protein [Sinanaerobacter sp. ZZT-01]WRR92806.1 hypothetical protein U5921_12300 [Sinanaerobacter sp. ZZT-01]